MVQAIQNTPAIIPLKFVAGDTLNFDIVFTESIEDDIFVSKILKCNDTELISFTVSTDLPNKTATISLTAEQTTGLEGEYNWYFERTRQSETRTILAGKCEVISK